MHAHRDPEATKKRLLDAAVRLMSTNGYAATSVDDVCRAAGVTKGGFFHHFATKEDLAKEALHCFYAATGGQVLAAVFPSAMDPLQRVYGRLGILLDIARNPDIPKTCLIGNLTQEVSPTHPEIRAVCDQLFSRWVQGFGDELAEAKAKHAPGAPWDPYSVARYCLATIQGSLLLAKSSQDPTIPEQSLLHYRAYLQSLFEGAEGGKGKKSVQSPG
jgi:TetR/AcrR family transcriptional repressor of nem operon